MAESIDEATFTLLGHEAMGLFAELKRMHRERCRGLRFRHKGEQQDVMLRQEEERYRQEIQDLLNELTATRPESDLDAKDQLAG